VDASRAHAWHFRKQVRFSVSAALLLGAQHSRSRRVPPAPPWRSLPTTCVLRIPACMSSVWRLVRVSAHLSVCVYVCVCVIELGGAAGDGDHDSIFWTIEKQVQ
jgi:hypothetical protein